MIISEAIGGMVRIIETQIVAGWYQTYRLTKSPDGPAWVRTPSSNVDLVVFCPKNWEVA